MPKIKSSSDLPEWFDISKYDDARNLDDAGWYANLFYRSSIINEKYGTEFAEEIWEEILNNPIITNLQISKRTTNPVERLTIEKFLYLVLSVNKMHDLTSLTDNLESYSKKEIKFLDGLNSVTDEAPIEKILHPDWRNYTFLSLDTTQTDDELVESFKMILKDIRAEKKQYKKEKWESPYTKIDYKRWIRHGVLPYLDLSIWEKKEDVEITQNVLGKVILDERGYEGDSTESIRKTTIPLSKSLITLNNLNKMFPGAGSAVIVMH